MQKSPIESWLAIQEHRKNHIIFLVEWISIFIFAWMFWSALFITAPGRIPPILAGTVLGALYATCMIYGRVQRVTGCKKCASALPFLRKEVGRRHLRDEEECVEQEYGGAEWDDHFVHVYCKIFRRDIITYRCRKCNQVWEETVELPGSGYKLVRRIDMKK